MGEWSAARAHRIRPEAAGPRLALDTALAQLARDERTTPCADNPDAFTSEDRATRSAAAAACALCPIRRVCSTYATAQGERWGVWAGVDRSGGAAP